MFILGNDLGFRQIKCASEAGEIIFDSVIGEPPTFELKDELNTQNQGIELTYDEKRWYVGERAIRDGKRASLDFDSCKTNNFSDKIKYLAAIGLSYKNRFFAQPIHVITGAPVEEYFMLKDSLELNMKGHFSFNINGQQKSVNVAKVSVIPQGAGAFYSMVFDAQGEFAREDLAQEIVMVIDVGFKTTDVVVLNSCKYDSKRSFTVYMGVSNIHKEIRRLLLKTYRYKITPIEVDELVKFGKLNLSNQTIDLAPLIEEAALSVADAIIQEIKFYIEDARIINHVLLVGGGQYLLQAPFQQEYSGQLLLPEKPEFANAIGYYRYGKFLENIAG